VVSEGDRQLEAARARNDFGVDGTGVTVGIISDSVNQWQGAPVHEASDVATGDLPGTANPCGQERPVKVLTPFIPGAYPEPGEEPENAPPISGTDEGRAMLQIVHDIAPGADLDFASGVNGDLSMAKAIRDLYAAGSGVIADDVYYFDEPFYQDGPIAVAVNEVASKGVDYFSAADNNNLINGQGEDIASWEAPAYREAECPAVLPAYYDSCMNFAPHAGEEDATFGIHLEQGSPLFLDLQWAQPWNGVTTDLDMFLIDEKGEIVERAFNEPNTEPGRQKPYELIARETGAEKEGGEEVEVVIARCDEACGQGRAGEEIEGQFPYAGTKGGDDGTPRLKLAIVNNGGGVDETEYPPAAVEGSPDLVGPTVFGHTAAPGATSVAAISVTSGEEPERYSSRGPAVHLFGPVDGTGAAPPTGEQVIAKPNVTASDCGATTFFGRFEGTFQFCGTSAAAPHAAGVAALVRSANPGVSNAQLRAALESTAVPIGAAGQLPLGPDAVGAGLLDAESAVSALALPPSVRILNPPAALGNAARPAIDFAANRYAGFSCALDGGPAAPCRSPFVPPAPLVDGPHTFVVTATDLAGHSGQASARFAIDTKAPVARFAKRPKRVVKTRRRSAKLSFRLVASEPGSIFRCKVDGGGFQRCGPGLTKRFRLGRHVVSAEAIDAVGNLGRPAVFRFRIERIREAGRHAKRRASHRLPSP
jgi:subtilisin family serine protease